MGTPTSVTYRGIRESVRLIGFDAPETGEPFSREATAALVGLVEGERLRPEFDVEERDQYGRLLAHVWVGTRMVDAEILRRGTGYLVLAALELPPDDLAREGWSRCSVTGASAPGVRHRRRPSRARRR